MTRIALANFAASVALLVGAGPALADSASISVTTGDGQPDSVAYEPRVFTISGNASVAEYLYVKHRAAGGAPCARSAYTDSGTFLDASFYGAPVSGAFGLQRILTWRAPGTWMLCFWLAPSETSVATPITQVVSVRSPAGAIAAVISPNPTRAGARAGITVVGSSEAPRRVYAKLRPLSALSCAPTFDADPGGSMIGGWSVEGAFSIKANMNNSVVGRYLICMWLAGDSDDIVPVVGPQAQVFDVLRTLRVVASSVTTLNCRTKRALSRFRAGKVKSVCTRYRFSTPPAPGDRLAVSFITPKRRTYKTVRVTWPGGEIRSITVKSLPFRAYKSRRGTWRVVLRVAGQQVKTASFRVT